MRHASTTNLLNGMFSEIGGEGSSERTYFYVHATSDDNHALCARLGVLMSSGGAHSQEVNVPFGLTVDLEPADEGAWNVVLDLDIGPRDWVVSSYSTDSMFVRWRCGLKSLTH